jgi:hypothetical protein
MKQESNMKIIGGIVAYEDGVKTVPGDQFSPTRKVRVELNFSLDDGEDADKSVTAVLGKAQAFVNGKLNLSTATAAVTSSVQTTEGKPPRAPRASTKKPDAAAAQTDLEELTGAPAASGGKTKADLEAEMLAKAGGKQPEAAKPAADPDDLSSLMGEQAAAPAKEITDADLNHAVQETNGKINTPENPGGPRIRKLVSQFIPDPTKQPILKDIPQDKRAAFLAELAKLTK